MENKTKNNWFSKENRGWGTCFQKKENLCEEGEETIVLFLMEGKVSVSLNGRSEAIIEDGYALLIPPATRYTMRTIVDTEFVYCYFNAESLLSSDTPVNQLKNADIKTHDGLNILKIKPALQIFLNLQRYYLENRTLSGSFFESKKRELFSLIFLEYTIEETASFLQPLIGDSLEFREIVVNNFLKVKTIGELASLTHYSTSGFTKKFIRDFKEPPYQWILKRKAERIEADIQAGKRSLQEIAHEYGFYPYSNFTSFCKTHLGKAPSEISCRK